VVSGIPPVAGHGGDRRHLPILLLSQYLLFLTRRPISKSNVHYLEGRLRGLQSLIPALADFDSPALAAVIARLRGLHPSGFARLEPHLQLALLPLVREARSLPRDLMVADGPPPADWLAPVKRVLVVMGPGIGIGDELILAALPRWLRATRPGLEVSVLSGYAGLWDGIEGVQERLLYSQHATLLQALRGEPPYDGYDLVILGDFEAPELYRGVAWEGVLPRYLELSLGSRSAFHVDNTARRLHRLHHFVPYAENYYAALDQLARELALATPGDRFAGLVTAGDREAGAALRVFVSPFTSKYDPSAPYWSRMLSELVQDGGRPLRLVLDPGKNHQTHGFSLKLCQSLRPRVGPQVEVELAPGDLGHALSLAGALRQIRDADVVVCADSFAAHASPLYGCTSLVIARAGLEAWRVPHPRIFYFNGEEPVDRISRAMRLVLAELRRPPSAAERLARTSRAELLLVEATHELERALEGRGDLRAIYEQWRSLYGAVVASAGDWPDTRAVLIRQTAADAPARLPSNEGANGTDPLLARHLRDQLERWQGTNLYKYLRALVGTDVPPPGLDAPEAAPLAQPIHGDGQGHEPAAPSAVLLHAAQAVSRGQLPTGEIATFFRVGRSGLEYMRSPLLSTLVHGALACFDPTSPWVETDIIDRLPPTSRAGLVRRVSQVRRGIRRFLAWEEHADGTWRFYGRGSEAQPDVALTAAAAAALLEAPRRSFRRPWERHLTALRRLRAADGTPGVHDLLQELRFRALTGDDVAGLLEDAQSLLARRNQESAERTPAEIVTEAYVAAGLWREACLPGRASLRQWLLPCLLAAQGADGSFGGPVLTAMALSALIDLEHVSVEAERTRNALVAMSLPGGGFGYEAFLARSGGSAAASSALALTALARSGSLLR
jgi:hypothetical protein